MVERIVKTNKAVCLKCKKKINLKKDHYLSMVTLDESVELERVHFHIQCWKDWFNSKVKEKFELIQKQISETSLCALCPYPVTPDDAVWITANNEQKIAHRFCKKNLH